MHPSLLSYQENLKKALHKKHVPDEQIEELFNHIRESYEEKCADGLSDEEAARRVMDEVGDIKHLAADYVTAKWYARFAFWKHRPALSFALIAALVLSGSFLIQQVRVNAHLLQKLNLAMHDETVFLDDDINRSPLQMLKLAREYDALMQKHNRTEYGDRDMVSFISFHKNKKPTVTLSGQEVRVIRNPDGTATEVSRGKDGIYRPTLRYMEIELDKSAISPSDTTADANFVSGSFYTVYPNEAYQIQAIFGTASDLSALKFYRVMDGRKWYRATFTYTITEEQKAAMPDFVKSDSIQIRITDTKQTDLGCYGLDEGIVVKNSDYQNKDG